MFIVFIGPPGAGKGTQSKLVVRHLQIPHISTGDLLRAACSQQTDVGREAQRYMQQGQLVPDKLIIRMVEERLDAADCQEGCLLDGFPRTLPQAIALDEFLNDRGTPLDVALELRVDEEVLVERLAGRGRSDDQPTIIRERLRSFSERTQQLLDYYDQQHRLETVDGLGPPEMVFERIKAALALVNRRASRPR